MNRRVARLRAAQALYQIDLTESEANVAIESVVDEGETPSSFMLDLVHGTLEHKNTIDPIISSSLQGWTLDRMGLVDRAIVRMSIYEMKFIEDIPVNVTLNEGIELAKAFGGEESGKFVNGVLSKAMENVNK
ncbi:transcription antitermination factor NusB [Alkalihalobacillus sp. MEB130]|uniref:transcription antitermination factor NusB n=1 Tax=Alkalihalobacillus sp. MEB130 TaxID=2976704 RepID=UPI0028DDBC5B|nr:transcription antitermination factor NusB [Alkalihalobacillus sp. MEB130]MDT8862529.1 transcription antitermination factor NusB [Alkalihalobacillus sp. MEB130]